MGTTPQALSFGWLLPRFLAPQPANQNDRSAVRKRADAKWRPQTEPQQQVRETPLAATGTDVVAPVKVIASSGTQQDASRVHIVASREGAPPGRGAPVVGVVQAVSGPTAPSPAQAPGATPSSRTEFDDNDPTDPEALPFGATQTHMTSLESLLSFLRDVWLLEHRIRQLGETEGVDEVYKLYSGSAQWQLGPTWSTEQNTAYLDSLKRLREDLGVAQLTGDAATTLRQYKALEEEAARSGAQWVKSSVQQGREATGFLHFYNVPLAPQGDSRVANERIYLSLKAEAALEVMRFVTRELVYNPQMAGITGAKIAGPQKVGQRGDAIVIYGEDLPYNTARAGQNSGVSAPAPSLLCGLPDADGAADFEGGKCWLRARGKLRGGEFRQASCKSDL